MDDEYDIPENSMFVVVKLAEKNKPLDIMVGHNLDIEAQDPDAIEFMEDLCNGIKINLDTAIEGHLLVGRMARSIRDMAEMAKEIEFEPDEELLKALDENSEDNVIPFNKDKIH